MTPLHSHLPCLGGLLLSASSVRASVVIWYGNICTLRYYPLVLGYDVERVIIDSTLFGGGGYVGLSQVSVYGY